MAFGKNVKIARMKKNISLQELASLSGVSVSMLSKIEREEKTPTIRVAAQIAKGLRLPLAYLIDDGFHSCVSIVKKDQRKVLFDPLSNVESLVVSPAGDSDAIEILFSIMPVGNGTGTILPQGEGVRKYIVVLKGKLNMLIDSDRYDLEEGDCMLFDASVPYEVSSNGDEDAEYYLIIDRYGAKFAPVITYNEK
ncbi:MAG TPA: XRE family transcriptional regulator [Methylomusa anaerophila]|uniref:DNA-binding transcriptional repressor PuuR n=1 Tax=Methylomusa anaerophila TaxID=1930071 RepID=A0A348AHL3_9FIRM|nr:XRE family transcriptional regulator [Methylomusa anaerophila]BBB90561.1 DNA-binding transcriptional repressor PuuR [Methylomusa anaerophila]HML88833.1 XRE family transcriptional regulator [Methylomusa anaerophila]